MKQLELDVPYFWFSPGGVLFCRYDLIVVRTSINLMHGLIFVLPLSFTLMRIGRTVQSHRLELRCDLDKADGGASADGRGDGAVALRDKELRKSQWQIWAVALIIFLLCALWVYQEVSDMQGA